MPSRPQAASTTADTRGKPALPSRSESRSKTTPFHTAQWGRAWEHVTTEQVTDFHLRQWPLPEQTHHLPFYRVEHSPLWTTLEGDAQTSAPVWQGPVTYARTLYGTYGGLPGAPLAVLADAVDRGRHLAGQWGTAALVVSNLPDSDAQLWSSIRPPDARVGLYWSHRVELASSVEEFVTADLARKKSRRDLRRLWRRGTESGLSQRLLHGREMLPLLPTITQHARETSERHGPALYGHDMLAPLVDVPGAFALVADHEDGPAGAFLCFRSEDTVYLWTAAIDQVRKRALNTYGWLTYSAIAHACASGARWLDAGRGNYAYKAQLGLTHHRLSALVYLTRPDRALCERLAAMDQGLERHAHRAWARTHRAV